MKKWVVAALFAILVISLTSGALADQAVAGGSDKFHAARINCGIIYESVGTKEDKGSYSSFYQFTAPANDICTISFEVEKHYWHNDGYTSWLIVAFDSDGEEISYDEKHFNISSDSFTLKEFPCVIATLSIPVERGKTYVFMFANSGPYMCYHETKFYRDRASWTSGTHIVDIGDYRDPVGAYRFSVCLKGTHATAYPYTYQIEKAPTCEENGIESAKCEWCGAILDRRSIPALGHQEGEWKVEQVATCWEDGFRAVRCTVCNEILDSVALPMVPHTQGKYTTILEPTCEEPGREKAICEICGATVSERPIDPLGHEAQEGWQTETEPTCDHEGADFQVCSRCELVIHRRTVEKLPHTLPEEWTLYRPATCETEGLEIRQCLVCGEIAETRSIPALGHTPGEHTILLAPTCVLEGRSMQVCTTCNEPLKTVIMEPFGHSFTDWIITVPPTAESEGQATRFCTVCGETEAKKLNKLN